MHVVVGVTSEIALVWRKEHVRTLEHAPHISRCVL